MGQKIQAIGLACVLTSSVAFGQERFPYMPMPSGSSPPMYSALGPGGPSPGYTLFQPMQSNTVYLIDESGAPVHTWPGDERPGLAVYLRDNGNLLRTERIATGRGAGGGGRVGEHTWDNQLIWEFEYVGSNYLQHHDVEPLPNGNVLMIAWETMTLEEAVAAGRDPALIDEAFSPDKIVEIQPDGQGGADIVWEWRARDHLIQDFDATKDNFGVVADHPELINLNFPPVRTNDWIHLNSVKYNAELDQIVVSSRKISEIWVIDHSTTTAEAAGHTGGNSGKGGDILYRWGNPQAYDRGTPDDRILWGQHDVQWIEEGRPGEGNLICFNNGTNRPEGNFSTIEEWVPPVDGSGNYTLDPGMPFGPKAALWTYIAANPISFFSNSIAGVERLANGNTLICEGRSGELFEVNQAMETVWEFDNPFPADDEKWIFKARRYDVCLLNGKRECPEIGTTYCDPAVPNSTGQPGVMTVRGSDTVGDDVLELVASQLPTDSNIGYFLMGDGTNTFVPPGSVGRICIGGGSFQRFLPPPSNTSDLPGGFTRSIGTQGPVSGVITAGSTWNFQAWHRDGMDPSNLTNAVSVSFQ